MNVLNQERMHELINHRSPLCVSLFMPTHRAGRERQQDVIRLKNMISTADDQLRDRAESAAIVDKVLQSASELPRDDDFWRHRSDGLACFCAPDFFRAYRVPLRLDEQLFVERRFHFRPLLPLLKSDSRLYILSLTQDSARLFEATKYSIREIELPDLAPIEVDGEEQQLQIHSHRAAGQGKGATETAVYHGHGGPTDRAKKDTLRFFQLVDGVVVRVLRGQRAPLVLACVGYLAPLYDSANSYQNLIKGKIPGSPDRWSDDKLRDHAWNLVEPHIRRQQDEAWQRLQNASATQRASDNLQTLIVAADEGRVDSLFLARGAERWGHVDPESRSVRLSNKEQQGEELLEYAAAKTLVNGGDVFVMESLPNTDSPAAAMFRY